jgi:hypothetical protein
MLNRAGLEVQSIDEICIEFAMKATKFLKVIPKKS